VLTGINLGLNIGHNIWHSGTVAAAKQASFLGIPAIAFSAPSSEGDADYGEVEPFLKQVIELFLAHPDLPLLNVNFPERPRGLRWTKMSVRHYEGFVIPGEDPMGRTHYWFTEEPRERVEEGHRPLGDRAGLRLPQPAASRPDRRRAPRGGARAPRGASAG
jgi:5'-nucleotidase